MLNIIDVSEAQGSRKNGNPIIWTDVARWTGASDERVDAVIVKATEGNGYVDSAFLENWTGASVVGLLLGAYHFAHPDSIRTNDAKLEARFFVQTVKLAGGYDAKKHLLALDIEEARHVQSGLGFVNWVADFCDEVEAQTGARCAVYCGGPFFDSETGNIDADTQARLARHPLWLAAYVTNPARFIPKPWKDSGYFLHQESGDVAPAGLAVLHVAGIGRGVGNVDHDVYAGSLDELKAFVESLVSTDPPASTDPAPPPVNGTDPRLVPHYGEGSTLAEDIHALADTVPDSPTAKSSQKIPAVNAPILGVEDGSDKEKPS